MTAAAAVEAGAGEPSPDARMEMFRFTGTTREYFGIWIVNLFLTLVTLGIYSAWAKVRKKRYLYGNTWLAESNFEYHGNAVAILKGRLIAVAAFVGYTLLSSFSARLGALLLLAMMPVVPWLIVRSFAFNAVNSSYRNLRFHFTGGYREAAGAIWPFFVVALLGVFQPEADAAGDLSAGELWLLFLPALLVLVAYPYVVARVKLLQANRARYGTSPFSCGATVGAFYLVYVNAFMIFVVAMLAVVALALMTASLAKPLLLVVGALGYVLGTALVLAFTRARIANLVFNHASLGGTAHLVSTLEVSRLAKLYAGNLVAVVLTFGLAVPWAVIRTARYRADCLALRCEQGLEAFFADVTRQVAATGEELGEMFDFDLSL